MNNATPRLRMFAGPNGSGKSTIKEVINKELLGVYINSDEIEKDIKKFNFIDFTHYQIITTESEIMNFLNDSTLLTKADLLDEVELLKFNDNKLFFLDVIVNSYFASVCADFIRQKLLENKISFTFETVMSSYDKVEFLQKAQKLGYRTYLYYVATEDPVINISRVNHRVLTGGHPVPEDKIVSRYHRSLDYLFDAIRNSNRAYIFDNSSHNQIWVGEITDGSDVELKQDIIPKWVYDSIVEKAENSNL